MNAIVFTGCALGAGLCGGAAAGSLAWIQGRKKAQLQRRQAVLGPSVTQGNAFADDESRGIMGSLELLTRKLYAKSTQPLCPWARGSRVLKTRSGRWFSAHCQAAGCSKTVSPQAFCELRFRLLWIGAACGALFGSLFSVQFALLAGFCLAAFGYILPRLALSQATKRRAREAQSHLSEMLEITALGLRSGLTFDRSFGLYGSYFTNGFAQSCTRACKAWTLGLCSREEALREFAASYDCEQLSRIVDSILRSLRFGTALAQMLREAGDQARSSYRAELEERIARAPVKMMIPTGTLILPAMLLLVLGPVLLELAGGF